MLGWFIISIPWMTNEWRIITALNAGCSFRWMLFMMDFDLDLHGPLSISKEIFSVNSIKLEIPLH